MVWYLFLGFRCVSQIRYISIIDATLITWELVLWGTLVEIGPHGGVHQSPLTARSISNGYKAEDVKSPDSSPTNCFFYSLITYICLNYFISLVGL